MIWKFISIYFLIVPLLFANEEDEVKLQFMSFVEKINAEDISFIDKFDQNTVSSLRNRLQNKISQSPRDQLTTTGLPENYQKIEDFKFIKIVFSNIFLNHPKEFRIPSKPFVHGVVFDSNLAFLVYSFKSDDGQYLTPSAMAFKKSDGTWKIASISFENSILKIWKIDN
jgi:hypothetical protein